MGKHICDYNDAYGVGDKEESFVEQGHQVGIKDDRKYYGLTNFCKKGRVCNEGMICFITSIS